MAQSGSAYSGQSSLYNCHLVWSSTPNTSTNKSTVGIYLYADHHAIDATVTWSLAFNGQTYSGSQYLGSDSTAAQNTLVKSLSVTVDHNADGSLGAMTVSGSVAYNLTSSSEGWVGSRSCSTSVTYDTIPRASSIASVTDVATGAAPTVTWTALSANFQYKVKYVCGSASWTSGYVTSPYSSKTIPSSWAQQFKKSKTATATCYLYTYDANGNLIGSASKAFTLTCNGTPSVSLSKARSDSAASTLWPGSYVQSATTVRITAATTQHEGSTVKTAALYYSSTLIKSVNVSDNAATFDITPDWYGSRTYTVRVTDERGNTGQSTISVSPLKYEFPKMSAGITMSSEGTLVVSVTNTISVPSGLANTGTLTYKVKLAGTQVDSGTRSNLSTGTLQLSTSGLDATKTYEVTLTLADLTGDSHKATIVATTSVICISRRAGGKGVTFFQEAEEDGLWVKDTRMDYDAGDTFTAKTFGVFGLISDSAKKIAIYVPFPQFVTASAFTVTGLKMSLRHVGGGYVGGTENYNPISSGDTVTAGLSDLGLRITIEKTAGWGITNNTPLVGSIELTGSFS